jgi:hypothetical protein
MESTITMPFQDFREFLDALKNAGELLELDRPGTGGCEGDAEECVRIWSGTRIQE